jgi:hypothetical protein
MNPIHTIECLVDALNVDPLVTQLDPDVTQAGFGW